MAKKKYYYKNISTIERKASGVCSGTVQPGDVFESSKDLSKEYWAELVDSKEAMKLFSKEKKVEEEVEEEVEEVNSQEVKKTKGDK